MFVVPRCGAGLYYACGMKKQKSKKKCLYCGAWFVPWNSTARFCSNSCGTKWGFQNRFKGTTEVCAWCGATFQRRSYAHKYCTVQCSRLAESQRKRDKVAGKIAPKSRRGSIERRDVDEVRKRDGLAPLDPGRVTCLKCGKSFKSWDKKNNRRCPECSGNDDFQSTISSGYF